MRRLPLLTMVLGLGHGLADCLSGFLIGNLGRASSLEDTGIALLTYNILAFGGQLPVGLAMDEIGFKKGFAAFSLVLIAFSWPLFFYSPMLSIVFAGIGSAIYHVSGGMAALLESNGKALHPGIFAAPGVIGLAIGGFLAFAGVNAGWWLIYGLVGLSIIIISLPVSNFADKRISESSNSQALFDSHDLIMMALLLAIAMRSAVWNIFQVIHFGDYGLLLWIGVAAALGKIIGGVVADRIGWQKYAVIALGLASILLTFGERSDVLLVMGVGLLQSATPVAIAALYKFKPGKPATVAGITLGLAIVLGGIPLFLGFSVPDSGWIIGAILVLVAFLYGWSLRKKAFESLSRDKN